MLIKTQDRKALINCDCIARIEIFKMCDDDFWINATTLNDTCYNLGKYDNKHKAHTIIDEIEFRLSTGSSSPYEMPLDDESLIYTDNDIISRSKLIDSIREWYWDADMHESRPGLDTIINKIIVTIKQFPAAIIRSGD